MKRKLYTWSVLLVVLLVALPRPACAAAGDTTRESISSDEMDANDDSLFLALSR